MRMGFVYNIEMDNEKSIISQGVPLGLTVVIFAVLSFLLYLEIVVLNKITNVDILTKIHFTDVLVGMTIYLKTSVDFAIFIGNLMSSYPGWKNRVAIEIGTAFGNALGTIIVLAIWNFFRDIEWLLAIMIFIAALVLLKLAEEGLEHAYEGSYNLPDWFYAFAHKFQGSLHIINKVFGKPLEIIMPNLSMKPKENLSFWGLFLMSFTVPFILGLDDFAGYVPVFNIVNVFGFSIGVLGGHMILNALLFISPKKTITAVKNPIIAVLGSFAFILLALWGFYEVYKILFVH